MNLEQQVCSLDLAKRLKELGVKQDGVFWWVQIAPLEKDIWEMGDWKFLEQHSYSPKYAAAFTVAELGKMLPLNVGKGDDIEWLYCTKWSTGFAVQYGSIVNNAFDIKYEEVEHTEADARAQMLIYLIEHKLITV